MGRERSWCIPSAAVGDGGRWRAGRRLTHARPGQVYDVNSYALAAAGRDAGAEVNRIGIVSGDPRQLRDVVEGQLNRAEIVVIAGAVGEQRPTRCARCCPNSARWRSLASPCTRGPSKASGNWEVRVCRRFCCRPTR
ncbi:putative molybdopterin binding domain protein [Mycobacterium xenopi 4042]|uniref:Putative molybdopterin binding domain protein n=1 Tax=Mycobacterium xenopi 4042 TaxID=1299334 RepID=X8AFR8_MYCXE|nr:putative molybdopterin binding domain protein [Mycobacterium xenopi 4042]